MEANNFVAGLKAEGTSKDICDLKKVYNEYKTILSNLAAKDRGAFSLNVLCILCRNLDKVPSWGTSVDTGALLMLAIECLRQTRALSRPERVKCLACLYHLHKHAVKQNNKTSPDLILKISYMAFENDVEYLLNEYVKTYWNILADRLLYIERLKAQKCVIAKLLPKLIEDLEKVIKLYDTVQFTTSVLVFLIKKLYNLFSDASPKDLSKGFLKIFETLTSKPDLKNFKKLSEKDTLELYIKFNECFYVIAENSTKFHFKESCLTNIVRCAIAMFGHSPDIFHCIQTFFSNFFCTLLAENQILLYNENLINSVINSCETTEKLGYRKAMDSTYPYLNQLLRIYIEYAVNNFSKKKWMDNFSDNIQNGCLHFILYLLKKLRNCNQLLKCENCSVKTGLHDALRLSFSAKSIISFNLDKDLDVTKVLPIFYTIVNEQYVILKTLRIKGCVNYEKCYAKLQTDIHNTAISLNRSKQSEISLKLFDLYLKNEIVNFKSENELKNIGRALYNKSICQLDCLSYSQALTDAYLSLLFSYPEGLKSEKFMSLIMDIKAKMLKANEESDESQDKAQMLTSLDICENYLNHSIYGNLKPFFCAVKFSELLNHEFKMYAKLWPSVIPIAGVWQALHRLCSMKPQWLTVPDNAIKKTLYEVILETPTAVRNIYSEYYSKIVNELLNDFTGDDPKSPEESVIHASLLFLKSEFDLNEAGQKYGWKVTEPNMDPDLIAVTRTVAQEYEAVKCALRATRVWTDIVTQLDKVPHTELVWHALQLAKVYVQRFLYLCLEPYALQLAHICCRIATYINDSHTYIQNASILIYHASKKDKNIDGLISGCTKVWSDLVKRPERADVALNFMCDCAMYYYKCGQVGVAAKLARLAQAYVLEAFDKNSEVKLDMTVGRLMELQLHLCEDVQTMLSLVNGVQRHYLAVVKEGTNHTTRSLSSLSLLHRSSMASLRGATQCRAMLVWRRARAAAVVALPRTSAVFQARLFASIVNCHSVEDAQVKIDNRLKYILGITTTTETQATIEIQSKSVHLTPKQEVETMLENLTFRKIQTSPSLACFSVPGFKKPDFLTHDNRCQCYACQNPNCQILSCQLCGLEASMYFRAKEIAIARNYFTGVLNIFGVTENKLKSILMNYRNIFEGYLMDIVEETYWNEFKRIQIEILIEASYFELSQGNNEKTDEYVVQIHEIIQDNPKIDKYMRNEVLNLMLASAKIRNGTKKPVEKSLVAEMESLRLSPEKDLPPPKTPEIKPKKQTKPQKVIVKDEEIPKPKRRVIKLNLDDGPEDEKSVKKTKPKKSGFKIPVPVTSKPSLETLTPRPRLPVFVVHEPDADFATPKPKTETEFFTPLQTPNDQFFTPMTSVKKTYSKRSLRNNIVKNLEAEFSTPKAGKKNGTDVENVGARRRQD